MWTFTNWSISNFSTFLESFESNVTNNLNTVSRSTTERYFILIHKMNLDLHYFTVTVTLTVYNVLFQLLSSHHITAFSTIWQYLYGPAWCPTGHVTKRPYGFVPQMLLIKFKGTVHPVYSLLCCNKYHLICTETHTFGECILFSDL